MNLSIARGGWNGRAQAVQPSPVPDQYQLGRVSYSQGNYESAIPFFTRAIKEGTKDLMAVLEIRAAAYTKLGNHQAALRDVHQMLKQDKANVKGYLSGIKILTLMGNHSTAKELYEKAIGKFRATNPDHLRLKALYATLALGKDPLSNMPLELVEMVLSKLDFRDICRCTIVSKSWLQLLGSLPNLWTDLNFITARNSIGLEAIRKYITRGHGLPTRVTLDQSGIFAKDIPRFITTRCKGLYELVIPGGLVGETILQAAPCANNLKTLIIGSQCQISRDAIVELLENCKALERADFHRILPVGKRPAMWCCDLSKLQSLTMVFAEPKREFYTLLALERLVQRIPNIRKLILRGGWYAHTNQTVSLPDFSLLKHLESLGISGMIAEHAPQFPSSLHSLDISKIDCPMPDISSSQFPKLVRLSFASAHRDYVHYNNDHYYKAMLEANKGRLTHLDATARLSGKELEEVIASGYLQSVEELRLGMCDVDDNQATLLAKHAPNIRVLHLERTNVTGVGVKALVTALKGKLEFLGLDECRKCSEDANKWASSMGVKTSFKYPDENIRGGRRLRMIT